MLDIQTTLMSNGYAELTQLAKKANIFVILELLTALHHSRDHVEKRDRLSQAVSSILIYSPWRKPVDVETMSFELLDTVGKNEFHLLHSFFSVASSLPLTWSKEAHHCHYAALTGQEIIELIAILIEQPNFRQKVGARQLSVVNQYLDLCSDLLEICEDNQKDLSAKAKDGEAGHGSIWCSFLLSRSQLRDIPSRYDLICNELNQISLPIIPYFSTSDGQWILSEDLLTITLLYTYLGLLEYAYAKAL